MVHILFLSVGTLFVIIPIIIIIHEIGHALRCLKERLPKLILVKVES